MAHLFPFIVVASVIISKILARSQQSGPGPTLPTVRRPTSQESEQERLKRFMEAVGLPPDASPPPAIRPQNTLNQPPLPQVRPPSPYGVPGRLRRAREISPAAGLPPQPQPSRRPLASAPQKAPVAPAPAPAPMAPLDPFPQSYAASGPAIGAPAAPATPIPPTPAPQFSTPAKSLLIRLRNPTAIREAVVLREILGPPKAFQSFLEARFQT